MSNRLSNEKSPYLLQHKDNPVDWYPWGEEAFQKAKEEEKPIFLSIGYSTCHWCHVMARESFEDEKIAELLESFVCIKVDREERPDIDAVYMNVCLALTGSGGWPLTIFMTPDQKPFFAGTYFPKTGRYGQPGLQELLQRITHLWKTDKARLTDSGDQITAVMQRSGTAKNGEPNQSRLTKGYTLLSKRFDPIWGGFGEAPKFPTPHNLLFLMDYAQAENKPEAMDMVEKTLKAMAAGGIYDHIGGGFSRYSTDDIWLVPHFEKMLYDNALLMMTYTEAFQLTKNQDYTKVIEQTADYILNELTAPEGGFYCGQDADSEGVEGKYYVWTQEEIIHVLGEEDGTNFCQLYDITAKGNFLGKNIPNQIGKTETPWHPGDPRMKKLREHRRSRTKLHLDNKILLSWNAWMIIAMIRAGNALNNSRYREAALQAYKFIKASMTTNEGRLYHRFCEGEAAHAGQLEDYAVYALALIELYEKIFEVTYLSQAIHWAKQMLALFEDSENGGFYMTTHDAETLITRPKEVYDGAIPSGNSVAAMVLEKLANLTGEMLFREASDRQLQFLTGQIQEYPAGYCFALLTMAKALYPHKELLCTGSKLPKEVEDYIRENPLRQFSILYKSKENEAELAEAAPFTKAYPIEEKPLFYLCENGTCHAPEKDFKRLKL